MYKKSVLYLLIVLISVGCSPATVHPYSTLTSTPEKTSTVVTKSTPTIESTPVTPYNNQELLQAIPKYEGDRITQVELSAGPPIAFTSDSTKIFLNKRDGIYLLNLHDAETTFFSPHKATPSYGMVVSRDGSLLASVDAYGKITIRDINSSVIIQEMQTTLYQSSALSWLEFSDDGSLLVSSGYFQPVTVWDTRSGQVILETLGYHAAISPDGKLLALRGPDYIQIIVIQHKVAGITKVDDAREPFFLDLLFSRDGNYLYGLNVNSEIKVWDVHTGEVIRTIKPCTDCIDYGWEIETPRMTLSKDGSKLLLADPIQIILWDTQTWEKIMSERIPNQYPSTDASISPDGKTIVVTYQSGLIRFFYLDQ